MQRLLWPGGDDHDGSDDDGDRSMTWMAWTTPGTEEVAVTRSGIGAGAAEELARRMAKPSRKSRRKAKGSGMHLRRRPRSVNLYIWQNRPICLGIFSSCYVIYIPRVQHDHPRHPQALQRRGLRALGSAMKKTEFCVDL